MQIFSARKGQPNFDLVFVKLQMQFVLNAVNKRHLL